VVWTEFPDGLREPECRPGFASGGWQHDLVPELEGGADVAGRELIFPATVLTSHLESCAAELAADPEPPDDLAQVVGRLVSGQRHIAVTLERIARQVDAAPVADRAALAEILRAAARATGHAADALAEGEHLFE
jgi:hypothetical protein